MNTKRDQTFFAGVNNPDPYAFELLKVLPTSQVTHIDEEIKKEVVPFLSKIELLPKQVQLAAMEEAYSRTPSDYCIALASAWRQHNELAKKIDAFVTYFYKNETAPKRTDIGIMEVLLRKAFAVEEQKRILSAGVKPCLEYWISHIRLKAHLSEEELLVALTTDIPGYWLVYEARHTEYLLSCQNKNPEQVEQKRRLVRDFHASNDLVMKGRMETQNMFLRSKKVLSDRFLSFKKAEKIFRERAHEGWYRGLENSIISGIRDLMCYDNFFEYSFGYNLFGIPDLFLRKLALATLIKKGLIDKRDCVLLYLEKEILEGIKKL